MRVIGTAGHVDHGKSTLVEAITGYHPDRLQEEIDREMTIVLGFSWFSTPSGEPVGIIDVPGHRDFIENMLSGIGGIDAALLVIAADEGVMPQTREHLSILDLLAVQNGIVVLTKIDLVDDEDWLDLVESEVIDVLKGTSLQEAPIIRVSASTGENIGSLIETIDTVLSEIPRRKSTGRPRMSVDRAFSLPGFGTIVTGTLIDGNLEVGDRVTILPSGASGKIRGLQTHKEKEQIAVAGSRTAINISGVSVDQISRGDVVSIAGMYDSSRRIDVNFRMLPDLSGPLKHHSEMKLFIGAKEVITRVRVIRDEQLNPGDDGWLQLEPVDPIVVSREDRFVLRRPSPGETIGGGTVLDAHPARRYKRFDAEIIERFNALSSDDPRTLTIQRFEENRVLTKDMLFDQTYCNASELDELVQSLVARGDVNVFEQEKSDDSIFVSAEYYKSVTQNIIQIVQDYHKSNPLRKGMPVEELRTKLDSDPRLIMIALDELQQSDMVVKDTRANIRDSSHSVIYNKEQQKKIKFVKEKFKQDPFAPPSVKDCIEMLGEDVYFSLLESGEYIQIGTATVFQKGAYGKIMSEINNLLDQESEITVASVRDHLSTSRKYVLAILEHFDEIKITRRVGDIRVRYPNRK